MGNMEYHGHLVKDSEAVSPGIVKTKLVPISGSGVNLVVEACFLVLLTGFWTACKSSADALNPNRSTKDLL